MTFVGNIFTLMNSAERKLLSLTGDAFVQVEDHYQTAQDALIVQRQECVQTISEGQNNSKS